MSANGPARAADPAEGGLPVAGPAETRRAGLRLIRRDGRAFVLMIALNVLAAAPDWSARGCWAGSSTPCATAAGCRPWTGWHS